MPKSLTTAVITQIDAVAKAPILLFELGLTATIRFALYKTNIIFPTGGGGNTFNAKYIEVEGIQQSLEGQIDRITVKFDNVYRDMAAYANNEDFRGKSLIIKRVYLDALDNAANYIEVFNGSMERPTEISRSFLTVPATIGKPLNRNALITKYQKMCPWIFGGVECNTDGLADLTTLRATGTADNGSTSTLIDNALTQIDDYWNDGNIAITHSGVVYYRKVKNFDAASDEIEFDVELPVTVGNPDTYVLTKGCDQTWDTCKSLNSWGPSGDNKANFGGCIHVTKVADAE